MWINICKTTRYRFGSIVQNEPSRFIAEIPEQYLDRSYAGGGMRNQPTNNWQNGSAYDRMNGKFERTLDSVLKQSVAKQPTMAICAPTTRLQTVHEHVPSKDFAAK